MIEYQILDDNIVLYNLNNQLYIMNVKIDGYYYIEINSRTKFILRRKLRDYKTAELTVGTVFRTLSKYNEMEKALKHLKLCSKMKTLNEFVFLNLVLNTEIDFDEVYIFMMRFGFTTNHNPSVFGEHEFTEISEIITVTFPNRSAPLGSFRAIPNSEAKYNFELF